MVKHNEEVEEEHGTGRVQEKEDAYNSCTSTNNRDRDHPTVHVRSCSLVGLREHVQVTRRSSLASHIYV